MILQLLFPCDYYDKKSPDSAYLEEYTIAKSIGFKCNLFDFDKLIANPSESINCIIEGERFDENGDPICLLYRGWMMPLNRYVTLSMILDDILITSPEEYEKFHYFDRIYSEISGYTPVILSIKNINNFNVSKLKDVFSEYFLIKDNVKSVKGSNFPDKISVDISQAEFETLIKKFIELRGDLYTGEIVLKQYVNLKKYGDKTNEYRVFYFLDDILTISRNSNQPASAKKVNMKLVSEFKNLGSFYTIDFAETEDGDWIIIETGDGQVSGLSPNQNILEFYSKMQSMWTEKYVRKG